MARWCNLEEAESKLLEEISNTFDEMFVDCDEELRNLAEEKRDIELFLKKTFPEAIEALNQLKKDPSRENEQALESSIDLLNTQYTRIDHISLTVEHLVSSLAKLMDRLESHMKQIKEGQAKKDPTR